MKKMIALLMGLVCVIGLTACGGNETKTPELDPEWTDVQAMVDAGAFSEELEEVDADTAFMLYKLADYGLVREDMLQATVLRSAGATCEEAAVLIFADADKASIALSAVDDYVISQIESNKDYRPNEIPKLEEALIERSNETVRLVVANDLSVLGY